MATLFDHAPALEAPPEPTPEREALLSPDGRYRYRLARTWDASLPTAAWVMLNPSIADALIDDATIRKCRGFSERNGFGRLEVVNLFAYRATQPSDLQLAADPFGPENDDYLVNVCGHADVVIAGWGAGAWPHFRGQLDHVLDLLDGVDWWCIGTSKYGDPLHPSRPGYDRPLIRWPRSAS